MSIHVSGERFSKTARRSVVMSIALSADVWHVVRVVLLAFLAFPALVMLLLGWLRWSGLVTPRWLAVGPVLCGVGMVFFALSTMLVWPLVAVVCGAVSLVFFACTPRVRRALGMSVPIPTEVVRYRGSVRSQRRQ
jgi:hypothetical protein